MSSPSADGKNFEDCKDEHLYGNLNSPTFETVENAGAEPQPQMSEEERQRQMEEWKEELLKVEEEIKTLRQVLGAKVRKASELKRMIGITPFQEFKQDFNKGIKQIQSSDTYQKTNEKLHDINDKITQSNAYQKTSSALHTASEKTNAVVSSVASSVTKKLGDIRNSPTFKSVEEKVGGAVANVKSSRSIENLKEKLHLAKVAGSKSEDSFDEALKRETEAKGNDAANGTQQQTLPEEKIPL